MMSTAICIDYKGSLLFKIFGLGKPHATHNSHHSKLLKSSQVNQLQNEKNRPSGNHFNGSHIIGL